MNLEEAIKQKEVSTLKEEVAELVRLVTVPVRAGYKPPKPIAAEGQKVCGGCYKEFPIEWFHDAPDLKDGKRAYCPDCDNLASKRSIAKRKARNRLRALAETGILQTLDIQDFPWEVIGEFNLHSG